ncbi:MAG: bifunctional riboflavin kinase/FAD synthetase [Planctomycetes bacterium]|nr:bifunctional riboflavin kinase/FAD synthetase [Planctomycetota bacterium]
MIVTRSRSELPAPPPEGAVVSIGVFDGVHKGHQQILADNLARARAAGARSSVVTFAGHPKELLLGRAPRTLTTLEHRLELFRRAGVEHALVLCFDDELRSTPAERFIAETLVEGLGAREFVLGFDSKFGLDRAGMPALLRELGHTVHVSEKVVVSGRAVSSTAIREAVELGDLAGAEAMLGRRVSVFGEVVEGKGLGREMGFPTANLDLRHELSPPTGVYACRAKRVTAGDLSQEQERHGAVVNIGFRPTVDEVPSERPQVEALLLDFEGDLYGEFLELEFVSHIREEQRFQGLEELSAQIARDVEAARAALTESSLSD